MEMKERKSPALSSDKFGINMKQFCREHEAYMASAEKNEELLNLHLEKLRWLQHERLVHLIVTVMVVIIELFVLDLVLLHPETGLYAVIVMLGLAILLGFYFFHYFFLENTVQHWYRLAWELMEQLKQS